MADVAGTLLYLEGTREVLVIRRANGKWDLPKGHVQPGETLEAGAIRETQEETGLTPKLGGKIESRKKGKTLITIFEATASKRDVTLSHEHVEYQWVTEAKAIEILFKPLAKIVKRMVSTELDEEATVDRPFDLAEEHEKNPSGGLSCGIFLPLPYSLAKDFPDKKHHDDSVPHMTLLYCGDLSAGQYHHMVKIVRKLCRHLKPFLVDVSQYSEFTNDHGQRIPHMAPSIAARMKLSKLHALFRRAMEHAGIPCKHTYGPMGNDDRVPYEVRYKPHATLAYKGGLEALMPYKGAKPQGSWRVTEIECWGHERISCPLGKNKYDQPLGLTRDPLAYHKYPAAVPEPAPMRESLDLTRSPLQVESETSLKGYERHADPGSNASRASGGLGLATDPRYQDWIDKVLKGKTKKKLCL